MVLFAPVLLPLSAFRRWGVPGYVLTMLGIAGGLVLLIALAGSTATTATEWLVSIGGMMLICTVTYTLASLPGLVYILPPRPGIGGNSQWPNSQWGWGTDFLSDHSPLAIRLQIPNDRPPLIVRNCPVTKAASSLA